ncbi:gll2670 [Gloeobacter violaceus PCC 7421]|uniref:Gll2670 protein n=1 Tax=Gloeobacter violaceus (strain ATCC 29082 / PCC 7421) TaxID=251221 RepID=Q7NH67_GLOVI|nr:gll2670 [Gloeobacter violaceus PCC 7421]
MPVQGPSITCSPQQGTTSTDEAFAASAAILGRTAELAAKYVASLAQRPVGKPVSVVQLAAALEEPLPEQGTPPAAAVEEWLSRAEPGIVASAGPRYFGFVIGGTTAAALAGDWLASAIDQNACLWATSPAAVQTELVVMRWLKELFQLPADWVGALTSGTSNAHLIGLAAARQWVGAQLGFDPARDGLSGFEPVPVVCSTATHVSTTKALATLGLGRSTVRQVPAPGGVIDLGALAATLQTIGGPAIVIANAGEVNTGAFDPLDKIADLCQFHPGGAWLHVDGAFGLCARLCDRLAPLVQGVERADSLASDGHKWLNLPYDCGFVFVRNPEALRSAFSADAAYIAPEPDAGWDPTSHMPELSRRFRGLAAWCAIKAYGRIGYRALVERCVGWADEFGRWVQTTRSLELVAPVSLNIVCFRYIRAGLSTVELNALNRAADAALREDGRVFLSSTVWQEKVALRAAFNNWATGPEDLALLKAAVQSVARNLEICND